MNIEKIKTARMIIEKHFGLNIEVPTRKIRYVTARQFYYHWLKVSTTFSLKEISETLPYLRQDHTTILNALKEFRDKSEVEPSYLEDWREVSFKIDMSLGKVEIEELIVINAS